MTLGLSPKVVRPAGLLLLIGVALLVAGVALKDAELKAAGLALLVGGGGAGAVGHQAPPGEVAVDVGQPSDELLGDKVTQKLKAVRR